MLKATDYNIRKYSLRNRETQTSSHQRCERGQSLVEAVLCMLVLLVILFGIIQASLAVYSYHFIAEAAREGARYAVVRGSACTGFASACPASATDIQNYVKNLGFPGIDNRAAAMTVTVTCGPGGSNPATPAGACSAGNNDPGDIVKVAITYHFPLSVPFWPTNNITMNSASQMTISQ
jgi:Flp pilus assembly protein TadG